MHGPSGKTKGFACQRLAHAWHSLYTPDFVYVHGASFTSSTCPRRRNMPCSLARLRPTRFTALPILSGPVMVLAAYGRDMGGGWCLRACVRWVSMLRAFFLPVPVRLRTTDVIFGPRLSALALVIRFRVSQRISTPLDEPDRSMYLRFSIFFFCGSYRPKTIFGGAGWTRRWETAIKTFIFRRFRPARVRRRKSRRKIPKNKNFYLEMTNIVTTRRPPL